MLFLGLLGSILKSVLTPKMRENLIVMGIVFYITLLLLLARKQILKYKFQALESVFVGVLILSEVNIFVRITPLTIPLPRIEHSLSSSTLSSMMTLLGPLLGLIGALVVFFYKSLEDRKMFWEKELIQCMEKPYRKKAIIEELRRRVNRLATESKEIKSSLAFVFLMFVLSLIVCLINQNFFPAGLYDSSIRLIIPAGFFVLSILSILPVVFSFHGGLGSILQFPTSVNPMLTLKDARNILSDDPFAAILICFFTVETATEQLLSSCFELPKIRSHTYLRNRLGEISLELGRRFEYLSEIRNKTVFGLLEPDDEIASRYIAESESYLKCLDDHFETNAARKEDEEE